MKNWMRDQLNEAATKGPRNRGVTQISLDGTSSIAAGVGVASKATKPVMNVIHSVSIGNQLMCCCIVLDEIPLKYSTRA